jgi:uncharacterized protein
MELSLWAWLVVGATAVAAGAVASVSGFGIGSLLTPLLSAFIGAKAAVAVVSIPHLAGTALRFWFLRNHVDRAVLRSFGIASAAGGVCGAALHSAASNRALSIALGLLLLLAASAELTGWTHRLRLSGPSAWVAGALSGLFGGLVGNQGGIRSAALLGFGLPKQELVATATAVALMVDGARMPIYALTTAAEVQQFLPFIDMCTVGVVAGTIAGERVLRHVPEAVFRRLVAVLLASLGIWLLIAGN